MNQYIKTSLGVAVIIIMASTIGFFSWAYYQNNLADAPVVVQPSVKNAPTQACTQEAKLCPDGVNYVGRTEANCEFAECLENETSIANPASVFCEQNGGKLEIRTESGGGQVGYCKFSDGTECEEWKYFRGECK